MGRGRCRGRRAGGGGPRVARRAFARALSAPAVNLASQVGGRLVDDDHRGPARAARALDRPAATGPRTAIASVGAGIPTSRRCRARRGWTWIRGTCNGTRRPPAADHRRRPGAQRGGERGGGAAGRLDGQRPARQRDVGRAPAADGRLGNGDRDGETGRLRQPRLQGLGALLKARHRRLDHPHHRHPSAPPAPPRPRARWRARAASPPAPRWVSLSTRSARMSGCDPMRVELRAP